MSEPENPPAPKVLMIAGVGRSGSTLLGRLLAESEGFAHVGELNYIWLFGFKRNNLCGCGAPFRECPFWKAVFDRGFGGMDAVDYERILHTKSKIERTRTLPRLLSPIKSRATAARLEEYVHTLSNLYRAIACVSGASVVVDGSKAPPYAYLLARVPDIDLSAVHLVRDSRAVAHSFRRRKKNPVAPGTTLEFAAESPERVACVWNVTNLLLLAYPPRCRTMRLRYEDFVQEPQEHLNRISDLAGAGPYRNVVPTGTTIHLGINHTIGGNPDRFQDEICVKPDDEWQSKMPRLARWKMTLLTGPLLALLGYGGDAGHKRRTEAGVES